MQHILAVESSCDETAASVMCYDGTFNVKSNIIASQIDIHKVYGGVVPEIASRKHIECISQVVEQAVDKAGVSLKDIDAVAVTYAPGLVGALLVGVNYAKSLAYALKKPLVAVHHIEAHIAANYIESPRLKPPFICLVASGGHCTIALAKSYTEYTALARTRDDAPGEAFDKIAKALDLGYPGGPAIEQAAKKGDSAAFKFPQVTFNDSFDFSFSGVKTAVINTLHKYRQKNEQIPISDIAASFQYAVCEVLSKRLCECAQHFDIKNIALAGGVASNSLLRQMIEDGAKAEGLNFYCPKPLHCTDNAAMTAIRGFYDHLLKRYAGNDLNAVATREIGTLI
ncbi:MAG: tRNA (adenosine(37)-N6)-threonylcarbamoyltransferase complex transferase subunit TsaD [Firmicutes bacterium]|nr:tRNA (adenosine(37)-N6)-threonylcarbamoyltransferase complex transferase subunit TsaD [Bacillota bacterium]